MNFELKDHTRNNFITIVKIEKGIRKDSTLINFFTYICIPNQYLYNIIDTHFQTLNTISTSCDWCQL